MDSVKRNKKFFIIVLVYKIFKFESKYFQYNTRKILIIIKMLLIIWKRYEYDQIWDYNNY